MTQNKSPKEVFDDFKLRYLRSVEDAFQKMEKYVTDPDQEGYFGHEIHKLSDADLEEQIEFIRSEEN